MRRNRLISTLSIVLGSTVLLASCGGDDDTDTDTAPGTSEAADTATETPDGASDGTSDEEGAADGATTDEGATGDGYAGYSMTIVIDEPAELSATYTLQDLDPGLSSYLCFGGNGAGFSVMLAGIAGLPLTNIELNTVDAVDAPGTYEATGRIIDPDFTEFAYRVGEMTIDEFGADSSAGSFQLGPDDFAQDAPVVTGTWDCAPS